MSLGKIRAVQIDLARQIETVDEVCRMFDLIAGCGMNMVILYLEDRIKTESYPYSDDIDSYSPAQIAQIHAHADKLGLELVPVVSNFGHTERFLRHPELAHLAELRGNIAGCFSEAGHAAYNVVCPLLEETNAFFDRYIAEVAALFKSRYFHVGLDEIWDMGHCELCRSKVEKEGLSALLTDHILHTHELLKGLGKTLMMWDDMFEECPQTLYDIPRDIVLCAWNYGYICRRPEGHFNNARRVDTLSIYDKLGFAYLCTTWSGVTNVESYTEYARRHEPMGMFFSTWEMSRETLSILEPLFVSAGMLWQGDNRPVTERLIEAVSRVTPCSRDYAAAVAAMLHNCYKGGGFSCDPAVKMMIPSGQDEAYILNAELILERMRANGEGVDPVYDAAWRWPAEYAVLTAEVTRVGLALFDYRSAQAETDLKALLAEIAGMKETVERLYAEHCMAWDARRPGLPRPDLESRFDALRRQVEKLTALADTAKYGECGSLEVMLCMPDQTTAPMLSLKLTYTDGTSVQLESGSVKSSGLRTTNYQIEYAVDAQRTPASCTVTVTGYGAIGVDYMEVRSAQGVYVPVGFTDVQGSVLRPANLLLSDKCTCLIGEESVQASLRDERLSRKPNGLTVQFKKQ